MKHMTIFWALCVTALLAPACVRHDDSHGHSHGHGSADDGHPTVAVTRWTSRTELFMEYPAFVAGQSGRSAIHITDLQDFSPLGEGEAVVGMRSDDGRVLEFRGGPSRPGIFGVDLEVDRPGSYEMWLRVETPELRDLHQLGSVTVHPADAHPHASGEEDDGAISFLKEQQWTLEFGTAPVTVRTLRSSFAVPATVQPRTGGDLQLAAPVPGSIDPSSAVPVPGTGVRAGDVLARVIPRSGDLRNAAALRAAVIEAEQVHTLATKERDRAARLVTARAIPSRRLDEAEAAVTVAEARLDAARTNWSRFETLSRSAGEVAGGEAIAVRAPFDGIVSEVRIAPGATVEEGQELLRLVDPDRLHVVGNVPESRAATLASVAGGELVREAGEAVALGAPIFIGQVIDPIARTTEVRFAIEDARPRFRVGQSVRLRLLLGEEAPGPAIPLSAVVEDGGRPVVFVQLGGESFERRPVRLGSREGDLVRVLDGVEPGERVVHRGAYLVRLAAMSTQIPAHGHVH